MTFAAMTVGGSPARRGGGLDRTGPGERREHVGIGVVGREQAGARQQERVRRIGRLEALAGGCPERDLAAVEPAERETESQAFGEEGEVVGGVWVHRAAVLHARPMAGHSLPTVSTPGGDAVRRTVKNSTTRWSTSGRTWRSSHSPGSCRGRISAAPTAAHGDLGRDRVRQEERHRFGEAVGADVEDRDEVADLGRRHHRRLAEDVETRAQRHRRR